MDNHKSLEDQLQSQMLAMDELAENGRFMDLQLAQHDYQVLALDNRLDIPVKEFSSMLAEARVRNTIGTFRDITFTHHEHGPVTNLSSYLAQVLPKVPNLEDYIAANISRKDREKALLDDLIDMKKSVQAAVLGQVCAKLENIQTEKDYQKATTLLRGYVNLCSFHDLPPNYERLNEVMPHYLEAMRTFNPDDIPKPIDGSESLSSDKLARPSHRKWPYIAAKTIALGFLALSMPYLMNTCTDSHSGEVRRPIPKPAIETPHKVSFDDAQVIQLLRIDKTPKGATVYKHLSDEGVTNYFSSLVESTRLRNINEANNLMINDREHKNLAEFLEAMGKQLCPKERKELSQIRLAPGGLAHLRAGVPGIFEDYNSDGKVLGIEGTPVGKMYMQNGHPYTYQLDSQSYPDNQ